MLAYAVELGIIDHNPARDIDTKKLTYKPVPPKQDDVYTFHEAQLLLRYLEGLDDPYALAIRLDFNLFVRIGELAAIRWGNVNIPNRRVFICQQITHEPELNDDLSFSNKKIKLEDYPKGYTEQGYRSEYLKDEAVEILKKAHEINPDGDFVFMPNGKPIVTLTFNKHLKKYCEAVGIPYRSSHKIRFYVASTAYNGENLVQISKMMGCGVPVARVSHRPSRQTRPVRSVPPSSIFATSIRMIPAQSCSINSENRICSEANTRMVLT